MKEEEWEDIEVYQDIFFFFFHQMLNSSFS